MPNAHRGEIEAELGGRPMRLVLTLGALAELEAAFAAADLLALAERFERGRLSARDVARVLGAGLRGAGNGLSDEEVMHLTCADGAAGLMRVVTRLLAATFGAGGDDGAPAGPGGPATVPHPWRAFLGRRRWRSASAISDSPRARSGR